MERKKKESDALIGRLLRIFYTLVYLRDSYCEIPNEQGREETPASNREVEAGGLQAQDQLWLSYEYTVRPY